MSASASSTAPAPAPATAPASQPPPSQPATTASTSTSPRQPSSPPTSLSTPSTTTNPAQPIHAHAPPLLQQTLPSPEAQRHIDEARAAVVASMGNMLDSELQSRAGILHENAAALEKQEKEVVRATDGLRKEREKLAKEADVAARKVKELGNVQNWAEVLERGFLVLEETVRLANGGSDDEDGGSDGGTCSCSDCGRTGSGRSSRRGSVSGGEEDKMDVVDGKNKGDRPVGVGNMDVDMNGKGKARLDEDVDMMLDGECVAPGSSGWSDASRSLMEPDSSTGTGRAKGSETASMSTTS